MTWANRIEKSINQLDGIHCGQIYFVGNHFTVPVKVTDSAFVRYNLDRIDGLVKAKIQQEIDPNYTYEIAYKISTKSQPPKR